MNSATNFTAPAPYAVERGLHPATPCRSHQSFPAGWGLAVTRTGTLFSWSTRWRRLRLRSAISPLRNASFLSARDLAPVAQLWSGRRVWGPTSAVGNPDTSTWKPRGAYESGVAR